ncbi:MULTISPECIES: glutamine--fructose-6-phosphate transaminase (isomerizing) [unclassified Methylocaldum]|jgi:glucosamine--fructose-6-phosphate aminotransferase (isomerizing)|uniref:glutamine--fructose-6-phosphate transaminase (isomerizing) n=1 Tax=unclassified Methylocaldum TaxID=2622260 RepID=UPI000989B35B|nr:MULTISPECIES: glutamine--fructose-6-phosphate transaminase (isomerizing) [unclassified Methylocaldum]MBP1149273.1 glucosamine--fructose-6-phosphate aminotransferase (isomerizing) [Methylocaldum sp. RMAD-M]MVF21390.1 glutamine--fructose-6-phosphate transaminase (isomerizing) [Methylocaldum sp. BRCS4]
MCGIVGAIAHRVVTPVLLEGLRRLEYRGYDSAGLAVLDDSAQLQRVRRKGKIRELEKALETSLVDGKVGIAHTRWATHGVPSERNAHPHICRESVAVVHNGIIENHDDLRKELRQKGYDFESETDTEVIVHQIHGFLEEGLSLFEAVKETCKVLEGAYAIGVISINEPKRLIAARHGSPLVVGLGESENFIASDVFALVGETQRFIFLDDGDIADLSTEAVDIYDRHGNPVQRPVHETKLAADAVERGEYRHYMQKEIHEQPVAIEKTLDGRIRAGKVLDAAFGPYAEKAFDHIKSVQIVACGTSYHAGMVARYWMESIAGLPCSVEVASEFRYRKNVVPPGTLFVSISQSGETADTLAALKEAKKLGYAHTLAICNVPESSIVRESESTLMTRAGPEVGVASTKAFTTQLTALLLLVVALGKRNGLPQEQEARIVKELESLPEQIERVLLLEDEIQQWAERFGDKRHALYLGRGAHYPVAMEGALKLKEISYIHAEAYPSGELKHGPLALIDAEMPVVAVAPNNELLEKLKSNLQEVQARGGELYVFADVRVPMESAPGVNLLRVAETEEIVAPIVYTVPLQMLAYHVALIKGTDVDQPRNLAKSVTVE